MDIKIDFENKTIELLREIDMAELVSKLKSMFPNDWGEYKIVSNGIVQWPQPHYHWWNPYVPGLRYSN